MDELIDHRWLATVVRALQQLNGRGSLKEIYRAIELSGRPVSDKWKQVARSTIYAHSSDAAGFVAGSDDCFKRIARGVWALR